MWRTFVQNLFNHPQKHLRTSPVRYMFPLFLGLAALLGASALSSVSYSYIRIEPSQSTLVTGDRFSITVYANAHVPVNAVIVTLAFPADVVEIEGVDTGDSVITLWTEQPYIKNNRVYLQGGTYKRGFIGEHKIATIKAIAKKTGPAEFSVSELSLLAGDGKGTPVLTGKPDGSKVALTVNDPLQKPSTIAADASVLIVTDINNDGKVTLSDINSFVVAWQTQTSVYDFNSDGKMTFQDFGIILSDSFFGVR